MWTHLPVVNIFFMNVLYPLPSYPHHHHHKALDNHESMRLAIWGISYKWNHSVCVFFLNVWLLSLRAIFCISINITEAIGALFLVINKQCFVLLDRAHFFIHFLAFATVNTSAIKIYQQFFAWASVCGYSEWKARSGTAGSWGHSLFSTQRLQCCSPQKQHHLTFLPAAHRVDSFSKFFLVLLLKSWTL